MLLKFIFWFAFSVITPTLLRDATVFGSTPPQEAANQQAVEGPREGRLPPLFGKVTAIHEHSLDLTRPDGSSATVNVTSETIIRKDRQPAKLGDLKVGDAIVVRGTENQDHTWTAQGIAIRPPNGAAGGPGMGGAMGTLGKDYVLGEVQVVDPPKLTVLRPDSVTQVLELNEETSLRRGRDSITMADIKVGDHVVARGAIEKDAFVPKAVMVVDPERWKRMQEFMNSGRRGPGGPDSNPRPPNP